MPIFRRSPIISGIDTPTSMASGSFLMTPSSPPLMSLVNRTALRRCRGLLVNQVDVRIVKAALQVDAGSSDEYIRFIPEVSHVILNHNLELSTAAITSDVLDRFEKTGDDAAFERFIVELRHHQRHLAAVLDDVRFELRKRWRHNWLDFEEDEEDGGDQYLRRTMSSGDEDLTGAQVRHALRRIHHTVARPRMSSSFDDVMSDDNHVTYNTSGNGENGSAKHGSTALEGDRGLPSAVTPYSDCYSIVQQYNQNKQDSLKHRRTNEVIDVPLKTRPDDEARVTSSEVTWSATLIRNVDFRRLDIAELPSYFSVTSVPEGCRSVYVVSNALTVRPPSDGRRRSTVTDLNRPSLIPETGDQTGNTDTNVCGKFSEDVEFTGKDRLDQCNGSEISWNAQPAALDLNEANRAASGHTNALREPIKNRSSEAPQVLPKPRHLNLMSSEQSGLQAQTPAKMRSRNGAQNLDPPPLPARINLLNLRSGSLLPPPPPPPPSPPPPPPPRKSTISPLSSAQLPAVEMTSSMMFQVDVLSSSKEVFDDPGNGNGVFSAQTAIQSIGLSPSLSEEDECDKDADEEDDDDNGEGEECLDYNVSISSSLSDLQCLPFMGCSGHRHETRHDEVDDNYEPITPRSLRSSVVHSPVSADMASSLVSFSEGNRNSAQTGCDLDPDYDDTFRTPTETQRVFNARDLDVSESPQLQIQITMGMSPATLSPETTPANDEQTTTLVKEGFVRQSRPESVRCDYDLQRQQRLQEVEPQIVHEFRQEPAEASEAGDDGRSIVYEDIDQYQMMAELDDDAASAAYLDPATSASLSGRLRLLRAELFAQRRRSSATPGLTDRSATTKGYRRSSLLGPEAGDPMHRLNQIQQPAPVFWNSTIWPPSRRALSRGTLLVVVEKGIDCSSSVTANCPKMEPEVPQINLGIRFPSSCEGNLDDADQKQTRPEGPEERREPLGPLGCDSVLPSAVRPDVVEQQQHVMALDREGLVYYVPRSELRQHGDPTGEPWFYPIGMTLFQASLFVGAERLEGCFVVYRLTRDEADRKVGDRYGNLVCSDGDEVQFVLSVGRCDGQVLHYPIVSARRRRCCSSSSPETSVAVSGDHRSFLTVGELVEYYRRNRGRLVTRLRRPLRDARRLLLTTDWKSYEIRREDLKLSGESRGRGENSELICSGTYMSGNKIIAVSVKVLRTIDSCDGETSKTAIQDDNFVDEVQLLSTLQHDNIARFIGVSSSRRPFYLVTQLFSSTSSSLGSLKDFLSRRQLRHDTPSMLDDAYIDDVNEAICRQSAEAVAYLERQHYVVHRNVSTMCFEVSAVSSFTIKDMPSLADIHIRLGDFGRARSLVDDEYMGDQSEKIFVLWAAPEVLTDVRYSTKSDVWALAVVFWEVYSDGALPYSWMGTDQVPVYVAAGGRLDLPKRCPRKLFGLMTKCWSRHTGLRPPASDIAAKLRAGVGRHHHCGRSVTGNTATTNWPSPPHLKSSSSLTATQATISSSTADDLSASVKSNTLRNSTVSSSINGSKTLSNYRDTSMTSLPKNMSRPRAMTPPPRSTWHCAIVEPSTAPVMQFASQFSTLPGSSTNQSHFLAVPTGGRRKDSGSTRNSSKSSQSSGDTLAEGYNGSAASEEWNKSVSKGETSARRRKVNDNKKSARQSIRSLFNLASSTTDKP